MRLVVYSTVRLFGQSLGASIGQDAAFEAVQVEYGEEDLVERILEFGADVVLFDVSSVAASHTLRDLVDIAAMPPIVAVAVPATARHVMACAEAGVYNMVHRDATLDDLREAVSRAFNGEIFCRPDVTKMLFDEIRGHRLTVHDESPSTSLTSRESDVLRLVADGWSNKQIARELHLSVSTVKKHVHSLFKKLRLERRGQARRILETNPWLLVPAKRGRAPTPFGRESAATI